MNENKEFELTRNGQDVFSESNVEYVLPDYNGDVRKILYSEATLRPTGRFVGEDGVEFSGQIAYKVIYSDSENKISSAEFFSDYDMKVKALPEGLVDADCLVRISNFAIRLLGPRKFSAKSSIVAETLITGKKVLEPKMWDKAKEWEIQTKEKTFNVRKAKTCAPIEREIAESMEHFDGVTEDEVKILYYKSEPIVEECRAEGDEVTVSGRIKLSALVEIEGNVAYMIKKTVPFEQTVGAGEDCSGCELFADVTLLSERITVNPDDTGCEMVANIIFETVLRKEKNEALTLITDAYLTSCPTENTYHDFSYTEICERVIHRVKNTVSPERGELCEGAIREVVFVNAFPKVESVKFSSGAAQIKGEIKYMGVTSETNDDGSISYSSLKYTTEFDENVKISCHNDGKYNATVKIQVEEAGADIDAQRVYISSELRFDILACNDENERILSECVGRDNEKYPLEKATVRVYYPDPEEDLFEVARKFHIPLSRLCEANSISTEAVSADKNEKIHPEKLIIL